LKRNHWIVIGVIVIAALGFFWWRAQGKSEPVRYRTAAAERGSIESKVSATGTIRPVVEVEVGSQVSGTVQKIYADYNSRVHQGEVLLQIEPSTFRARELQAEAAVAKAEAALKDGERQLKRVADLLPQNYVSQADVDAAQAVVDQRAADLKQANAQLEAAKVDLANTTIRAPIDGVVISRSIDVGQTVAASLQAPTLFLLGNDLTQMQVETRIDEADIGQVRIGLPVTFTVDAFPDATFEGNVSQVRLEPITDQGVVTYTTVIGARNPELKLRPGMTANVSVLIERRDDVLKVPAAALRFRPAGDTRGAGGGGGSRGATAMGAGAGASGGAGAAGGAHADSTHGARGARAWGGGKGHAPGAAQGTEAANGTHGGAHGNWKGAPRGESTEATTAGFAPQTQESQLQGPIYRPGLIFVLRDGKPVRVRVLTGLSDGTSVEVRSDSLQVGDPVITGIELTAANTSLQPPPGMGGPQFRGPGGRPGGGGGGGAVRR
jgi:HlyD family secretion protein